MLIDRGAIFPPEIENFSWAILWLIEWLANLSGLVVSEADGDLDVVVTGSTGTFFLVLVMPGGNLVISPAIIPTP